MKRSKLIVQHDDRQLELFPVGTPDGLLDDRFAFQYLICRDRERRVYSVQIRQRLFREEKLRVITKRVPKKYAEKTASNCERISRAVSEAFQQEDRRHVA